MEKTTMETVIALVLGIILGVLSASSFWFLKNHKFNLSLPQKVINSKISLSPTPPKEKLFTLEISAPADQSIVNTATPNLTGKSSPDTLIIISLPSRDEVLRTDTEGNFQKLINLNEGLNYISVTAVNTAGQSQQINLTIVYESK